MSLTLASRAARALPSSTPIIRSSIPQSRHLHASRQLRAGDSHGSHYDPPTGWLWGVPPGSKPEKEGWEGIWYWGFCGGLAVCVGAYAFKPDTKYVVAFHSCCAMVWGVGWLPGWEVWCGGGAREDEGLGRELGERIEAEARDEE